MDIIWITNPDNYDPIEFKRHIEIGGRRVDMFAEQGYPVRMVHAPDVVAGWDGGPRLWHDGEDLLGQARGFMVSPWSWNADAAQHIRAISRTIRSSDAVLLNDGLRDPERLGVDKLAMYQHAGQVGVPVLPTVAVPFGPYAKRALAAVRERFDGAGYVVKPREMALGFGVLRAETMTQLEASIDLLAPGGLGCIIQPFFENTGDLRVFVYRGEALAASLREAGAGGLSAGSKEGKFLARDIPSQLGESSVKLAETIDAPYLAVDWLVTETGDAVFNEWMTIAASFEHLPGPDRKKVGEALFDYIGGELGHAAQR